MKYVNYKKVADILKKNGIGILPTDTLYGLVGRALSKKAFDRIFELKKRDAKNPFIILISSIEDLKLFSIKPDKFALKAMKKYWPACNALRSNTGRPGKVSIIFPCDNEKFSYLHLGTKTLAFRMTDEKNLLEILKETGPLLAPSANLSGEKPALTIEEAKAYFGDKVDFYIDGGRIDSLPSALIFMENGKLKVLRKGAVKVD